MPPANYTTLYEPSIATFIIRIFGQITEEDVIHCFQNYHELVTENFNHKKFNIIIHVDEEAHHSAVLLKLIRFSLENQAYREYIANIVVVNGNPLMVAMRNAHPSGKMLPFFISEAEARQYLEKGYANTT